VKLKNSKTKANGVFAAKLILVIAFIALGGSSLFAQAEPVAVHKADQTQVASSATVRPMVTELRGITIGMTADDVKDKLGKAEISEEHSLYYELADGESMQVQLDADKKVKMASMIYMGKKVDAPEYDQVFGTSAAPATEADGRIYDLVRYPDSGYWVAYSRLTVEDEPMTTVTIQSMD
jgi:hypothetical protein